MNGNITLAPRDLIIQETPSIHNNSNNTSSVDKKINELTLEQFLLSCGYIDEKGLVTEKLSKIPLPSLTSKQQKSLDFILDRKVPVGNLFDFGISLTIRDVINFMGPSVQGEIELIGSSIWDVLGEEFLIDALSQLGYESSIKESMSPVRNLLKIGPSDYDIRFIVCEQADKLSDLCEHFLQEVVKRKGNFSREKARKKFLERFPHFAIDEEQFDKIAIKNLAFLNYYIPPISTNPLRIATITVGERANRPIDFVFVDRMRRFASTSVNTLTISLSEEKHTPKNREPTFSSWQAVIDLIFMRLRFSTPLETVDFKKVVMGYVKGFSLVNPSVEQILINCVEKEAKENLFRHLSSLVTEMIVKNGNSRPEIALQIVVNTCLLFEEKLQESELRSIIQGSVSYWKKRASPLKNCVERYLESKVMFSELRTALEIGAYFNASFGTKEISEALFLECSFKDFSTYIRLRPRMKHIFTALEESPSEFVKEQLPKLVKSSQSHFNPTFIFPFVDFEDPFVSLLSQIFSESSFSQVTSLPSMYCSSTYLSFWRIYLQKLEESYGLNLAALMHTFTDSSSLRKKCVAVLKENYPSEAFVLWVEEKEKFNHEDSLSLFHRLKKENNSSGLKMLSRLAESSTLSGEEIVHEFIPIVEGTSDRGPEVIAEVTILSEKLVEKGYFKFFQKQHLKVLSILYTEFLTDKSSEASLQYLSKIAEFVSTSEAISNLEMDPKSLLSLVKLKIESKKIKEAIEIWILFSLQMEELDRAEIANLVFLSIQENQSKSHQYPLVYEFLFEHYLNSENCVFLLSYFFRDKITATEKLQQFFTENSVRLVESMLEKKHWSDALKFAKVVPNSEAPVVLGRQIQVEKGNLELDFIIEVLLFFTEKLKGQTILVEIYEAVSRKLIEGKKWDLLFQHLETQNEVAISQAIEWIYPSRDAIPAKYLIGLINKVVSLSPPTAFSVADVLSQKRGADKKKLQHLVVKIPLSEAEKSTDEIVRIAKDILNLKSVEPSLYLFLEWFVFFIEKNEMADLQKQTKEVLAKLLPVHYSKNKELPPSLISSEKAKQLRTDLILSLIDQRQIESLRKIFPEQAMRFTNSDVYQFLSKMLPPQEKKMCNFALSLFADPLIIKVLQQENFLYFDLFKIFLRQFSNDQCKYEHCGSIFVSSAHHLFPSFLNKMPRDLWHPFAVMMLSFQVDQLPQAVSDEMLDQLYQQDFFTLYLKICPQMLKRLEEQPEFYKRVSAIVKRKDSELNSLVGSFIGKCTFEESNLIIEIMIHLLDRAVEDKKIDLCENYIQMMVQKNFREIEKFESYMELYSQPIEQIKKRIEFYQEFKVGPLHQIKQGFELLNIQERFNIFDLLPEDLEKNLLATDMICSALEGKVQKYISEILSLRTSYEITLSNEKQVTLFNMCVASNSRSVAEKGWSYLNKALFSVNNFDSIGYEYLTAVQNLICYIASFNPLLIKGLFDNPVLIKWVMFDSSGFHGPFLKIFEGYITCFKSRSTDPYVKEIRKMLNFAMEYLKGASYEEKVIEKIVQFVQVASPPDKLDIFFWLDSCFKLFYNEEKISQEHKRKLGLHFATWMLKSSSYGRAQNPTFYWKTLPDITKLMHSEDEVLQLINHVQEMYTFFELCLSLIPLLKKSSQTAVKPYAERDQGFNKALQRVLKRGSVGGFFSNGVCFQELTKNNRWKYFACGKKGQLFRVYLYQNAMISRLSGEKEPLLQLSEQFSSEKKEILKDLDTSLITETLVLEMKCLLKLAFFHGTNHNLIQNWLDAQLESSFKVLIEQKPFNPIQMEPAVHLSFLLCKEVEEQSKQISSPFDLPDRIYIFRAARRYLIYGLIVIDRSKKNWTDWKIDSISQIVEFFLLTSTLFVEAKNNVDVEPMQQIYRYMKSTGYFHQDLPFSCRAALIMSTVTPVATAPEEISSKQLSEVMTAYQKASVLEGALKAVLILRNSTALINSKENFQHIIQNLYQFCDDTSVENQPGIIHEFILWLGILHTQNMTLHEEIATAFEEFIKQFKVRSVHLQPITNAKELLSFMVFIECLEKSMASKYAQYFYYHSRSEEFLEDINFYIKLLQFHFQKVKIDYPEGVNYFRNFLELGFGKSSSAVSFQNRLSQLFKEENNCTLRAILPVSNEGSQLNWLINDSVVANFLNVKNSSFYERYLKLQKSLESLIEDMNLSNSK